MAFCFLKGLSIDLDRLPPYHEITKVTFKEKLDKQICDIILDSDNDLIRNEMKEEFKTNVVDELDENGILYQRYYQQNELGRFLVINDHSLTSQHKDKYISFTLYKYLNWINMDMKLSWLSIVCEIMKSFKKQLPILNSILNNFDEFIETIAKYYQKKGVIDRRCVKTLIYKFLIDEDFHFSDWIDFLSEREISIKHKKIIHPLIILYKKEARFIRNTIYKNNLQLASYLKDKPFVSKFDHIEITAEKSKVLQSWFEMIETQLVHQMYKFLQHENIIKDNYCTLFADSIMFPGVDCDTDKLVEKFEKHVKKTTGYGFKFSIKSLGEEDKYIVKEVIIEKDPEFDFLANPLENGLIKTQLDANDKGQRHENDGDEYDEDDEDDDGDDEDDDGDDEDDDDDDDDRDDDDDDDDDDRDDDDDDRDDDDDDRDDEEEEEAEEEDDDDNETVNYEIIKGSPWNNLDTIYQDENTLGNIYLGNWLPAKDKKLLKYYKITRIINCTYDDLSVPNFFENDFDYYNFDITNWRRYKKNELLKYLKSLFKFIDDAIEKGESVFMHCVLGVHRSSTLASAYLMHRDGLTANDAISKVRSQRPIINPTKDLISFLDFFDGYK